MNKITSSTFLVILAIFVIMLNIFIIATYLTKNRNTLQIYVDPVYGCEYVATSNGHGLYPRLDGEQHVGCKLNALVPF